MKSALIFIFRRFRAQRPNASMCLRSNCNSIFCFFFVWHDFDFVLSTSAYRLNHVQSETISKSQLQAKLIYKKTKKKKKVTLYPGLYLVYTILTRFCGSPINFVVCKSSSSMLAEHGSRYLE